MDFSPNKKPIEIIEKGAFGSTYFRDIYSGINGKMVQKIVERIPSVKRYLSEILLFKLLWCQCQ